MLFPQPESLQIRNARRGREPVLPRRRRRHRREIGGAGMKISRARTAIVVAMAWLAGAGPGCDSMDRTPNGAPGGDTSETNEGLGSSGVVISQIYGGGGNSGATLKNDFIELMNRSSAAVNVSGWSVQYASSTGSSWNVTNLSGTIQPGHYYLIKESQGSGGSTNLPTADATGSITMSATTGKVALVKNQTALSCSSSCVPSSTIADFVGYGSASSFEGSGAAPTLDNTSANLRAGAGCTDTDNNA